MAMDSNLLYWEMFASFMLNLAGPLSIAAVFSGILSSYPLGTRVWILIIASMVYAFIINAILLTALQGQSCNGVKDFGGIAIGAAISAAIALFFMWIPSVWEGLRLSITQLFMEHHPLQTEIEAKRERIAKSAGVAMNDTYKPGAAIPVAKPVSMMPMPLPVATPVGVPVATPVGPPPSIPLQKPAPIPISLETNRSEWEKWGRAMFHWFMQLPAADKEEWVKTADKSELARFESWTSNDTKTYMDEIIPWARQHTGRIKWIQQLIPSFTDAEAKSRWYGLQTKRLYAEDPRSFTQGGGARLTPEEYMNQTFSEIKTAIAYMSAFAGAYGIGVGSRYAVTCKTT